MRAKILLLRSTLLVLCIFVPQSFAAQTPDNSGITEDLPSAPLPQTVQRKTPARLEANLRFGADVQNAEDLHILQLPKFLRQARLFRLRTPRCD